MCAEYDPMPGDKIFRGLADKNTIIMATNTRIIPGVVTGIFQAAKELNAPVFMELAKSESNLKGGYTGLTPELYAKYTKEAAHQVGFKNWALHADHITLKKGDEEDIKAAKELILAQIKSGYTSFAIDASFLFDVNGATPSEQLKRNVEVTTKLAHFIKENMDGKTFGLECEVGEIGKKNADGLVLTTVEEARTFIEALHKNGVYPNALAIANGSTHGNIYDDSGHLIEQVSINSDRTKEIADALADLNVGIAQHGITGTPRHLIAKEFPKGAIVKGNVGTFWMNIVWEIFQVFEPELFDRIYSWTINTYSDEAAQKNITAEAEIFGKYSKFAIKEHFSEIMDIAEDTRLAIEARAKAEAMMFFKAFDSVNKNQYI